MAAGHGCELFQIIVVDRNDLVAVDSKQYDSSIDDISEPGGAEETAGRPTELLIERSDVDSSKRLRQAGLTRATAPDLSQNSGVRQRKVAVELCALKANPHLPLIALQRYQGSAVENETHADFALRGECWRRPRTTVASCRSALCWITISSALISPNSFS